MGKFVCRLCGYDIYNVMKNDEFKCINCGVIFSDPDKFSISHRGFALVNDKFRKYPDSNIKLPSRSTHQSAGYDFYSPIDFTVYPGQDFKLWTDIKAFMNQDEILIFANRSSIGTKYNVIIKNIVPIIDSDYYGNESNDGNIQIRLINNGDTPLSFKGPSEDAPGSKVVQGIFIKYLTTYNDLPEALIRKGGIGSTGN